MFETNYDPIKTQEQDDEELRRQQEEEQQALAQRQQQEMAQDMENGANAGTGTGSTQPQNPYAPGPVTDLSKYKADIAPTSPMAPQVTPQEIAQQTAYHPPVQQPQMPVQPVEPQQVMPQQPQMMPAVAPNRGPVNPMEQQPIWSDIKGQEVNNGAPSMPVLQNQQGIEAQPAVAPAPAPAVAPNAQAPQPQAPSAPVAPTTTGPQAVPGSAGTNSQEVIQDMENGSAAANKNSQAYDILGNDQADKMSLGKIAYGEYPEHFRKAAEARLDEVRKSDTIQKEAKDLGNGVASGDPKAIRKFQKDINNTNPNEGSIGKLLLASLLGNKEAQTAELAKLGIGSSVHPYVGSDGQEYMVTVDAKGRAVSGMGANGENLPVNELQGIAGGNLKTARTTAIHAYDSEKTRLTKERDAWVRRGLTEDQLAARGLGEQQIEDKAQSRYNDTLKQASSYGNIKRDTLASNAQIGGPTGTKPAAKPTAGGTGGFDSALDRTMKFEGGYVENDGGRGPTNFGINSKSNPDVDVKNLTPETAKKIYKEKYWNGVNGIENLSPKSQNLIFDASVNQGVDYANNLLSKVGDDPQAIVAQREADYRALAERDPSKAKYLNNWIKRLEKEAGPEGKQTSILDNWDAPRKGEQPKEFDKRTSVTADEIDNLARGLTDGSLVPQDLTGRDTNVRRYAMQRAKEIDPNWSASDAIARRDALKRFTNPDGQTSKQIRAHITAANSIDDVELAFKALQNNNLPLFNQLNNSFREKTGSPLPINAKTGMMLLGPEIIKSIMPNGGGVTERLEAQHLMNTNLSPAQQASVFQTLKNFQGNALLGIENDWTKAKLPKDQFRERVLGDAPAAQDLLDYAHKHADEIARVKKDLKEGTQSQPAGPNPSGAKAELERRRKEKVQ